MKNGLVLICSDVLGDPEAFSGQMKYIIHPACSGSTPRSLTSWRNPEPGNLATEELFDYLSDLFQEYGYSFPSFFKLCLPHGGHVGPVQEFLKVLFSPLNNIPSLGLQLSPIPEHERSPAFPELL